PAPARKRWWWVAIGTLATGLLLGRTAWRFAAKPSAEPWTFRPITYSGRSYLPSISPDGKQVAFIWSGEKDREFDRYVQVGNGGNPVGLQGANPSGKVAWSPDGSRLAFVRQGGLYSMAALGGPVRRIAAFSGGEPRDVAWSADGGFFIVHDLHAG